MTKYMLYIIHNEGRLWALRRFGHHETMASGATLESIREQAFRRLQGFAPCSLHVIGDVPEQWRLESGEAEWEQVEP